jgi:hypothetical protein
MLTLLIHWMLQEENRMPEAGKKKRFGFIPPEPCRTSGMQPNWHEPCLEQRA